MGHEDTKARRSTFMALCVFVTSWLIMAGGGFAGQNAASPRTLDKGDRSQIMSAREVVVRAAPEWDALWRSHLPSRQPTAIDFSKEMVVGVFLGSRPTPGYGVTIVSATEQGSVLAVRYRETSPPSDAILAQVITFPYQIVAIPKSSATDVKFDKVK
jgi:protease stability complex PrcB-like protein